MKCSSPTRARCANDPQDTARMNGDTRKQIIGQPQVHLTRSRRMVAMPRLIPTSSMCRAGRDELSRK